MDAPGENIKLEGDFANWDSSSFTKGNRIKMFNTVYEGLVEISYCSKGNKDVNLPMSTWQTIKV